MITTLSTSSPSLWSSYQRLARSIHIGGYRLHELRCPVRMIRLVELVLFAHCAAQTSSAAIRGPKARLNATAVLVNQAIASGHESRSKKWVGRVRRIALNFLSG